MGRCGGVSGRRLRFVVLSAFLSTVLTGGPAAAAPVEHVTNSNDMGVGSLRAAVAAVDPGGTVVIDATHNPSLTTGQILIDKDVTITGQGMAATTIDANDSGRTFLIEDGMPGHPAVTIRDLTITDSLAPAGEDGGAIRTVGPLALQRVALTNNEIAPSLDQDMFGTGIAGGDGGAVYAATTLTVTDSVLTGNRAGDGAPGPNGGGVGGRGGAIELGAEAEVTRSTIAGNFAGDGGDGIGMTGGAVGGDGGGIATFADGLTLRDSTVSGNTAGAGGGATMAPGGADGGNGGGVAGNWAIVNSTIAGNNGGDSGGVSGSGGTGAVWGDGFITSATVTLNHGGTQVIGAGPGGVTGFGPYEVANSIVAGNTGGFAGAGSDCGSTPDDRGHNVGADPACPAGFSDADPMLDPIGLGSNGGPTQTIALLPGSPALDAVPTSSCIAGTFTGAPPLTSDQRGLPRPSGPACDTGAFEVQQPPAGATPPPASAAITSGRKCKRKKKRRGRVASVVAAKKKCKRRKRAKRRSV